MVISIYTVSYDTPIIANVVHTLYFDAIASTRLQFVFPYYDSQDSLFSQIVTLNNL